MKTGFTLIEILATLVLVAVLAVSLVISLLPMTEGLMQVRANADAAQKARLAMARLSREFTTITNVASWSAHAIHYDFLVSSGAWHATRSHTLAWSGTPGDPLLLEGVALSDDVADFSLNLYDAAGAPTNWVLDVVLRSQVGIHAFSNTIVPRNIGGGP